MTIAWNSCYAIGYPLINAQHQDFIEKLQGWHRHLQQEGSTLDLVVETNEALILWLSHHTRTVDGALGKFLHSRQA